MEIDEETGKRNSYATKSKAYETKGKQRGEKEAHEFFFFFVLKG
jgi:hypothetical protein